MAKYLFPKGKTHPNFVTGMCKTPFWLVWRNLKQRCDNPKNSSYKYYGERGISYCKRWSKFENFMVDMLPTYKKGLSLDRINNDKGYCKSNCRWVSSKEQRINQRRQKLISLDGRNMTVKDWCKEKNLSTVCFYKRLKSGMTPEKALTAHNRKYRHYE